MKSTPQILIFYTDFNLSRLLKLIILLIINNIINFNIDTRGEKFPEKPINQELFNRGLLYLDVNFRLNLNWAHRLEFQTLHQN
jgi:hypothetical protein